MNIKDYFISMNTQIKLWHALLLTLVVSVIAVWGAGLAGENEAMKKVAQLSYQDKADRMRDREPFPIPPDHRGEDRVAREDGSRTMPPDRRRGEDRLADIDGSFGIEFSGADAALPKLPDLVVFSSLMNTVIDPVGNCQVAIESTVTNQGKAIAGSSTLNIYPDFNNDGVYEGNWPVSIGDLFINESDSYSGTYTIANGTLRANLKACADDFKKVSESNEGNNCYILTTGCNPG